MWLLFVLLFTAIRCTTSKEWSLLPAPEPRPYGRRNSAMWCINDELYVYGGKNNHYRDPTMWVYQKETRRWTQLADGPTPGLSGMAYWGDGYLFGGRDDNGTAYDIVWKYGQSRERLMTNIGPEPRYGMLFWATNTYLYVYGGTNSKHEQLQDMWKLHISKLEWTLVSDTNEMGTVDDGSAVYHSKSDVAYLWRNNLWSFDLKTEKWTNLGGGTNSPPSTEDTALFIDSDSLYLYGGKTESATVDSFYSYAIKSGIWSKIETDTKPSARWGHSMCDNTYLFGGKHQKHPYDDLWVYESTNLEQYERYFLRVTTVMSILTFIAVLLFGFIIILMVRNKFQRV